MAEFTVNGTELESRAAELKTLNASFLNMVKDLEAQESALLNMWEGEAKDAFHKAFMSDKTQMTNFYNAIEKYVAVLQSAAAHYNSAEVKNIEIATTRL